MPPELIKHGQIEIVRSWALRGVEIHSGEGIQDDFRPHFHNEAQISHVFRGGREQAVERRRVSLGSGDTVIIPPGAVHHGASLGARGWSFIAVYFSAESLRRALTGLDAPGARPHTLGFAQLGDPVLGEHLLRLTAALRETPLAAELAWLALIAKLFPTRRGAGRVVRQRGVVRKAREYIESHVGDPVTLEELATLTGVSREHLVRSFTSDLGLPPHAYQINARIERAKSLLSGGASISDVSFALGFHDQSHFSRHFRRIVGIPPGRYRRAQRRR